jgi:tRNA(His) guanylyltransferase
MTDILGDRMKTYERFLPQRAINGLPIILRLDGRAFHTWSKGLQRPFDPALAQAMKDTTAYLVQAISALCGYTQSDEISLLLFSTNPQQQHYFDGKIQKLVSVSAAEATLFFHQCKQTLPFPERQQRLNAYFDCRFFQVPTIPEAVNYFFWREQDAIRNSVAMLAQHHFPLKALQGKNTSIMKQMLLEKGIDWLKTPTYHQSGSFFQSQSIEVPLTAEALAELPAKHHAHTHPESTYTRKKVVELDFDRLQDLTNPEQVLFEKAHPELKAHPSNGESR